jgi:hypothetical protein
MYDPQALSEIVQRNCHLSDARHARDYTMCVYLLKMREFYRWEKGFPLTQPLPAGDLGEWVVARERLWEALEPEEFGCMPLGNACHDPFDAEAVNAQLVPDGLVYSAGYGRFVKPHFFLGRLLRRESRGGHDVYVSSQEYARDLTAPPAMLRGETIFVRQESLRRLLWERVEEWRWQRCPDNAMARAVRCYPFDRDPEGALDRMTEDEIEPVILHELGEGRVGRLLGERWAEMLMDVARTRAEMPLRAVRDLVADCLVTLPRLLERGTEPSLHFFFANLRGHREGLFPSLAAAYETWARSGDQGALVEAVEAGGRHWLETAEGALGLYGEHGGPSGAKAIAEYVETRRLD